MGPKQFATFALPARGEVIVGRGGGDGVDVKLDDAKASRRHLRLTSATPSRSRTWAARTARASTNASWRPRTRVRVLPGEAISVGSLVLMVQPNRSARAAARGATDFGAEFERRIEWECARAEATGGTFSVARVPAPSDAGPPDVAVRRRSDDRRRRPVRSAREYELLLPGLAGETARGWRQRSRSGCGGGAPRRPRRELSRRRPPRGGAARSRRRARARRQATDADAAWPIACVEESMRRVQALAERAAAGNINVPHPGRDGHRQGGPGAGDSRRVAARVPAAGAINCAALSQSLLESELFGHERGAFTGAAQAKPGLLETAPGGTVFLDEMGELPPRLQAKLLRVIETREVLRVGGVRRARSTCASSPPPTETSKRRCRERAASARDLYFRLNGMTLTIPPLRERPRDIPVLARGFIASAARAGWSSAAGRRPRPRSRRRRWRCCVRTAGLATYASCALIERALVLCEGPALLPEHLPQRCRSPSGRRAGARPPGAHRPPTRRATNARASSPRWPRAPATRAAPRASSGSRARC